jgi:PEP-CTERM motif
MIWNRVLLEQNQKLGPKGEVFFAFAPASVPEPSSFILLGFVAVVVLGAWRIKAMRKAAAV